MTDAHCHVVVPGATRRFICPSNGEAFVSSDAGDFVFYGIHPWFLDGSLTLGAVRARLAADPAAGVGEIGLDRLRARVVSDHMRAVFSAQLKLAAEFRRPVVLHGAKCWGDVMRVIAPFAGTIPAFLFHGFSRSDGLLPEIVRTNGFVSVGPAVLNDHAVNYRALVRKIPADRLLVETDVTDETRATVPPLAEIVARVAALRGVSIEALSASLEANADQFISSRDL